MKEKIGKKFWVSLVIFGLMGQVAWVVENMYFNVFIYKMFNATAANISAMVAASAVAATLTTWLIGVLSDKVGKRKLFICGGYILWGISILAFAFIRMDILTPLAGSTAAAASLGVSLVIIMDCVMTFFGSTANDACFNAWLTDCGDETNRGKIEGINSMMPLVAILVVFGSFMAFDLDKAGSWTTIYLLIGISVIIIGILGFFLIKDHVISSEGTENYWRNVLYSFRPSVIKENTLLYAVIGAFAVFGISIQIFMPYLILYYEKTLQMENYVLVMAPAIILAALITAFYGKAYDMLGFKMSVIPTVILLMLGYVLLFFTTSMIPVFIGSLFMMTGYLTGMAMFGAMIRAHIPQERAGMFQGLRIVGQVLIPGMIGPAIGAAVLKNAEQILNDDGTTSFLPNRNIYAAAFVAAVVLLILLYLIFYMMRHGHYELSMDGEVTDMPWSKYPRPQMKRESFYSLNGLWQLNGRDITVPFAPQSVLSGYGKKVGKHLDYKKKFVLPEEFLSSGRVLLHFGAVDQVADIFLNGKKIGHHEGGYIPFTLDITEEVKGAPVNELLVQVTDTLSTMYPYGKQCKKRGGMWYTPISGIWQSVWVEAVPNVYIKNIKILADTQKVILDIDSDSSEFEVKIDLGEEIFTQKHTEKHIEIDLHNYKLKSGETYQPHLWTTDDPYLYQMEICAGEDKVSSYFAMREVTVSNRICLNGQPIFLHGVLDQGYYSDGIYLPSNEAEYEKDILRMKELGFNTLRKHIKVEPECFYYYCDKHGMLVMQDMVNNGRYSFIKDTALPTIGMLKRNDKKENYNKREKFFVKHMEEQIQTLYNHPSIIGYTIFNEGWGQFDSDRIYEKAKELDSSRFYDATSGWCWQEKSDVDSYHIYFKTMDVAKSDRPILISECGGFSYQMEGHIYSKYANYGYGGCESKEELTDRMTEMYEKMILPAIGKGLCGCIYTQLSDVEDETNGLFTYDRKECKIIEKRLQELAEKIRIE